MNHQKAAKHLCFACTAADFPCIQSERLVPTHAALGTYVKLSCSTAHVALKKTACNSCCSWIWCLMMHLSAFTVQLCQPWFTMMADVAVMLLWGSSNNKLLQPLRVTSNATDTGKSCCGITLGVIGTKMYKLHAVAGAGHKLWKLVSLVHNSIHCPYLCEPRGTRGV